jgi:hypothetical protein
MNEARIVFCCSVVSLLCLRKGCSADVEPGPWAWAVFEHEQNSERANGHACCLVPHVLYLNLMRFYLPVYTETETRLNLRSRSLAISRDELDPRRFSMSSSIFVPFLQTPSDLSQLFVITDRNLAGPKSG